MSMAADATGLVDLTDLDTFVAQRHHALLAWLRRHRPVHWNATGPGEGFWALTRYDDVVAAYGDHQSYSSAGGAMLGGSYRSEADTSSGRMLVAADPPRHRLLRQRIHQVFGPAYVARVRARVEALVTAALERAVRDGGCDFAVDVAPELPAGALMEIMGVSHEQAHHLISLTRRMIGFRDPFYVDVEGDDRLRLAVLQAEIFEFFDDVLRGRAAAPGDDLLSVLVATRVNGRRLSEEEIYYNCMNVAVGGNETSSYSACAGVLALAENPDQHALLLADPGLLPTAINEILRWSSTNAYVQRVTTREVTAGGVRLPAGASVTLWNVSANRDETRFPQADRFQVTRSPNRHLSYGSGIHRCVGAPVAQVELPAVFGHLISHRLRFAVAGSIRRLRSNFIQGITSLPLTLEGP
ncbi:putative cytochrome P450 126 [Acrocarpospora phusangensis]|uniref:Cytochrome P450 126 n=1 Tax=Acrocarpospora phusangensis TaxID=1070424 RepID=A0A919QEJ1_9ACTN|nr:cytochrome P450 [Acrocarpospora phusangensis]GIH26481.1 putative cytochrome P450 126 [Acrocarpospora phusangensis]